MAVSVVQPSGSHADQELVAQVRQGDDRAFEELYGRYRPRICAYVGGMLGDTARAEDITQEVFIAALRRLRRTDSAIAFKPWIYEIAHNACIDEFRRSRTRQSREVPLELDEPDGSAAVQGLPSTPAAEVEAAVEGKQQLRDLQGAFQGLSASHHQVIVMRELEGRSYGEIGERMGMTHPAVESTLHRARRRLREEYHELVSGRRCAQVQAMITVDEPNALDRLGLRQRRQVVRHLSHCQPCRFSARVAGLDDSFFKAPAGLIGKLGGLLPLPWAALRSWAGGLRHGGSTLSRKLGSVAPLADAGSGGIDIAPVVVAAAAIAVVGVAGGVAVGSAGSTHPRGAAMASRAAFLSGAGAAAEAAAPALSGSVRAAGGQPAAHAKPQRSSPRRGHRGALSRSGAHGPRGGLASHATASTQSGGAGATGGGVPGAPSHHVGDALSLGTVGAGPGAANLGATPQAPSAPAVGSTVAGAANPLSLPQASSAPAPPQLSVPSTSSLPGVSSLGHHG